MVQDINVLYRIVGDVDALINKLFKEVLDSNKTQTITLHKKLNLST